MEGWRASSSALINQSHEKGIRDKPPRRRRLIFHSVASTSAQVNQSARKTWEEILEKLGFHPANGRRRQTLSSAVSWGCLFLELRGRVANFLCGASIELAREPLVQPRTSRHESAEKRKNVPQIQPNASAAKTSNYKAKL